MEDKYAKTLITTFSLTNPQLVYITILITLTFLGCKARSLNDEFRPYVEAFILEGEQRGLRFDQNTDNWQVRFGNLAEGKAGSCKKGKLKHVITIDPDISPKMDSLQKQVLVFHELAHCVLDRKHKNTELPRGECASLMVDWASELSCFYDFYSGDWQDYYLDELFDISDIIPDWYTSASRTK